MTDYPVLILGKPLHDACPFGPLGTNCLGVTIVGGTVAIGGNNDAAVFRAFWISNWSITTRAAIDSTIGTARGTTQGSCLPLAASWPGVPSYCAVSCVWLIVAGLLNPILK